MADASKDEANLLSTVQPNQHLSGTAILATLDAVELEIQVLESALAELESSNLASEPLAPSMDSNIISEPTALAPNAEA